MVDPAHPPKKFARPRILLDLSLALIIGLCLGVTAAFLQEHLDNTLKNSEDIERFLQIPSLGAVPAMALPGSGRSLHWIAGDGTIAGQRALIGMGARTERGMEMGRHGTE